MTSRSSAPSPTPPALDGARREQVNLLKQVATAAMAAESAFDATPIRTNAAAFKAYERAMRDLEIVAADPPLILALCAALEAGEADTREVDAVRACIAIVDSVARSRGSHITPEVIAAANTMANAMRALLGEVARSPLTETTDG